MDSFETQVLSTVLSVIDRHRVSLAARGISVGVPEIVIAALQPRSSECRIWFRRNGEISDILEFEIYREGETIATVEEMTRWLEDEMPNVQ